MRWLTDIVTAVANASISVCVGNKLKRYVRPAWFGHAATPALFVGVLVVASCGTAPPPEEPRRNITIGTGNSKGVYFVTGNAICREVHKEAGRKHGIHCAAPSTRGGVYNIGQIAAGEMEFGMAHSIWQYNAYKGDPLLRIEQFPGLRAVFSIHPEPYQIIVSKDAPDINSFTDLKGRKFNIGNPGSGQRILTEVLMTAYGMSPRDFARASELTSAELPKALCEGRIDAYGYTVGVPNAGIAVATDGCDGRIINLDDDVIQKLVRETPYFAFATIPKGTYKTSVSDVTTFGYMATLVTSADVPEDVVYEVTRAVMENIKDFRRLHPAFWYLNPKRMIRDGLSAPLHAGAVRYYKERGWM